MFVRIIVIVFLSLYSNKVCSEMNYVIGGNIFYECLGEGEKENTKSYKIRLDYYITCNYFYADELVFTIYDGVEEYIQDPFPFFDLDSISRSSDIRSPCKIPSNEFCYSKLSYSTQIELPITDSSYHIILHNCCRFNETNNIEIIEGTGSVIYSEITSKAQYECNSSPESFSIPPFLLCENEFLDIDLSLQDIDGDQLEYEFYNPFDWVYQNTTWYYPAFPPPFENINYSTQIFTKDRPLGIESKFSLNQEDGVLSVNPLEKGFYLVGIAVKEYRQDELINTTYYDFVIKVSECANKINADIDSERVLDNEYHINMCNTDTLTIQNISSEIEYINSYTWEFDESINLLNNQWSPLVKFSESGFKKGKLLINENENCSDSLNILFNVDLDINAKFDYFPKEIDSYNSHVDLVNQSSYYGTGYFSWFIDSKLNSVDKEIELSLNKPKTYEIGLFIENTFGCKDSTFQAIEVLEFTSLYFPNAFTPNYDGKNDTFKPVGLFEGIYDFNLKIFDRWGSLIFISEDPNVGWNGMSVKSRTVPQGVYNFLATYSKQGGEKLQIKNTVLLLR